MPVTSKSSTYFVDMRKLRERFSRERAIRGVSRATIEAETGIHSTVLIGFENHERAVGVDVFVTLCRWIGANPSDFVNRRRSAIVRHIDTPDQRQIRLAHAFLDANGFEAKGGETAVETMIRVITASATPAEVTPDA